VTGSVQPVFPDRPARLGTLEAGRALAAIAVVLHHASLGSDGFTSANYSNYFDWGILGVDFFFVLSGFIIYHVNQGYQQRISQAGRYFRKRLLRIYVPYLPIGIGMIAMYLALPDMSAGDREWGWVTSLTLLPSASPPALSVAWTLTFELLFYTFFLLFFVARHFWLLVLLWVVAVLTVWATGTSELITVPLLSTLLDPLILEFVAGMIAAHVFTRLSSRLWIWPLALGMVGTALFVALPDPNRVLFGVSLAPVVLALAMAERAMTLRVPRAFLFAGSASYAIYLVHNPVISIVARVLQGQDTWLLTFWACSLFGIGAGMIYHVGFERPALRWVSGIGRSEIRQARAGHQRSSS